MPEPSITVDERGRNLRHIEVRVPGPRDARYSRGVEIYIMLGTSATVLDISRREAEDLRDKLTAFLIDVEG